jgi:hypothetical protein
VEAKAGKTHQVKMGRNRVLAGTVITFIIAAIHFGKRIINY